MDGLFEPSNIVQSDIVSNKYIISVRLWGIHSRNSSQKLHYRNIINMPSWLLESHYRQMFEFFYYRKSRENPKNYVSTCIHRYLYCISHSIDDISIIICISEFQKSRLVNMHVCKTKPCVWPGSPFEARLAIFDFILSCIWCKYEYDNQFFLLSWSVIGHTLRYQMLEIEKIFHTILKLLCLFVIKSVGSFSII